MISALDDMRIWAEELGTGKLLKPETQRQRIDARTPMNAKNTVFYGLGVFNDGGWIGHSGSIFGYQTVVIHLPEAQTNLVFFINTDSPHEASTKLANAITKVISPDHVYQ
jgi:D-alanyl-D-alanine carboxypeptidase